MSGRQLRPRTGPNSADDLTRFIGSLSDSNDLRLKPRGPDESPGRHRNAEHDSKATDCVRYIGFLWWQGRGYLDAAIERFRADAITIRRGWTCSHRSFDGHQQSATEVPRLPVTSAERVQLIERLLSIISRTVEDVKARQAIGRLASRKVPPEGAAQLRTTQSDNSSHQAHKPESPRSSTKKRQAKISEMFPPKAIPIDARLAGPAKRLLSGVEDSLDFKRPRIPIVPRVEPGEEERPAASDNFTRQLDSTAPRSFNSGAAASLEDHLNPTNRFDQTNRPAPTAIWPSVGSSMHIQQQRARDNGGSSVNTSINSNISSVFSRNQANRSFESETSVDTRSTTSLTQKTNSFYGAQNRDELLPINSSFDDSDVEDVMMELHVQDEMMNAMMAEEDLQVEAADEDVPAPTHTQQQEMAINESLKIRLQDVFPEASMECLSISDSWEQLQDYEKLWTFLKNQPALRNKQMPPKSSRAAWDAACKDYRHLSTAVVLSANFVFSRTKDGPLFSFQLQPLKLELSHRLSRRFGPNRFFEMRIPTLVGQQFFKEMPELGTAGSKYINAWLIRATHLFLGQQWRPFYVKDGRQKRKEINILDKILADPTLSHRMYLFAEEGIGFGDGQGSLYSALASQTKMPVAALLAWLIHPDTNQTQPFLKLFSRIALGLSKTYPTVTLSSTQIIFKKKDVVSTNEEVMNDGCGQISIITARSVAKCLGFGDKDITPSGFQARIGGAKGFWTVDYSCKIDQIAIYPSQLKWNMKHGIADLDEHQRTFEVVSWVQPLKSASLNLQLLPILDEGARDKAHMRRAIDNILTESLSHELSQLISSMESPESLRKWMRDTNPGIQDRIRHGGVEFIAGLPNSINERANLLLESGFHPKECQFLREMTISLVRSRGEELKSRLSIVVGQSCYAYMAVDYTGTLEENEIQLCFSNPFIDEKSGFNDIMLDDIDVLMTRSPAHFPSDVQKIRAVFHKKLRYYQDVILCSSKGDSPLAGKLSGGDYDGDKAWICWDQTLVREFVNSPVSPTIDLVQMGYLTKKKTTYSELCNVDKDPALLFLEKSFEFNLEASLLGICTGYKEKVTYAQNRIGSMEAMKLGNLLSCLVDAPKQGYGFNSESWSRFKRNEVSVKLIDVAYKEMEAPRNTAHIIDHLKFVTAEKAVGDTLGNLHRQLGNDAQCYDGDLVEMYNWALQEARQHPEWDTLMQKLASDVTAAKALWDRKMSRKDAREAKKGKEAENRKKKFFVALLEVFEVWQSIKPDSDTPLTRTLLRSTSRTPEFSQWELLKASTSFSMYYSSKFPWRLAGRQLCAIKAEKNSSGERRMISSMYAMLKPDATYVKLLQNEEDEPRHRQARAESQLIEIGEDNDEIDS